jgi:hypothetical protein
MVELMSLPGSCPVEKRENRENSPPPSMAAI